MHPDETRHLEVLLRFGPVALSRAERAATTVVFLVRDPLASLASRVSAAHCANLGGARCDELEEVRGRADDVAHMIVQLYGMRHLTAAKLPPTSLWLVWLPPRRARAAEDAAAAERVCRDATGDATAPSEDDLSGAAASEAAEDAAAADAAAAVERRLHALRAYAAFGEDAFSFEARVTERGHVDCHGFYFEPRAARRGGGVMAMALSREARGAERTPRAVGVMVTVLTQLSERLVVQSAHRVRGRGEG
jgi:hypothetical protein